MWKEDKLELWYISKEVPNTVISKNYGKISPYFICPGDAKKWAEESEITLGKPTKTNKLQRETPESIYYHIVSTILDIRRYGD